MKSAQNTDPAKINPEEQQAAAKPFIKWAGGKRQLLPQLRNALPESFGRYFEPMLGAGALFFDVFQSDPAREYYLADSNAELIACYETIRDDVEVLIRELKHHVFTPEYYYFLRNSDREEGFRYWSKTRKASRFIYLNRTCFNGLYRVNAKGQFNVPIGRYKNPTICDEANLRTVSKSLQQCALHTHSFERILEHVKKGDFVYFDPPYAPLSASSNFTQYTKEPFDSAMQVALRDCCSRLDESGVYFLLSNSSAPLILDLYDSFRISTVQATRAINSKASKRGQITEVLVRNY